MVAPLSTTITRNAAAPSVPVGGTASTAPWRLLYPIRRSVDGNDWTVRDPNGGAICRAPTYDRAVEIAAELADAARERAGEDAFVC